MEKKNKGGRPPLDRSTKKRYRVTVKMNTKDYYTVLSKAKSAGVSKSELLRRSINTLQLSPSLTTEEIYFIRQLSGMANNLNQLAHKANIDGYALNAEECERMANNVDTIIGKIKNVWKSNDKK